MNALPDLRPRSATPAPPPEFRLPRQRRRGWSGALLSLAIHAAIVVIALWPARRLLESGGRGFGPGPEGGGGGGGRQMTGMVALEPYAPAPQPAEPEPEPEPPAVTVTLPTPEVIPMDNLARIDIPVGAATNVAGAGAGAGPGAGPGTGGGQGAGTGTGVGPGTGPGSGGDGSYILRAQPRGVILPPECAKGARFEVRFWVAADGRVTEIDVQPQPREGSCRREFEVRMRGYRFEPARTREGVAVASIYPITIER